MSRANDLRLQKLEAKQFGRNEQQTRDELAIAVYECALAVLTDPLASEPDRMMAEDAEKEIGDEIIAQARRLEDPEYQAWLKRFERGWGGSTWPLYVPAVTGHCNGMSEYSDLDRPDIMERRSALWSRKSVQMLTQSVTQMR